MTLRTFLETILGLRLVDRAQGWERWADESPVQISVWAESAVLDKPAPGEITGDQWAVRGSPDVLIIEIPGTRTG